MWSVIVLQVECNNDQQQTTVPQQSLKFNRRLSGISYPTFCFEFQGAYRLAEVDVIPEL